MFTKVCRRYQAAKELAKASCFNLVIAIISISIRMGPRNLLVETR